jgi:predicted alpha/beta hydrolase
MEQSESNEVLPEPLALVAADGYPVNGFIWRRRDRGQGASDALVRPVAIVNAATSVRCRYYFRFAAFLFRHGWDVIVYDYRGIGESRPPTLRGFRATWLDWGRLDFEAVLSYAAREFEGRPVDVVAHSIGGFVVGLAYGSGTC